MEFPRPRWDADREPSRRVLGRTLLHPFALLRQPRFRRLSVAAFVYAGLALCLVAFMTVQLTTVVGLSLVQAGRMLAAYQIAGSISRPIWGWIADRLPHARPDSGGPRDRNGDRLVTDRTLQPELACLGGHGERAVGRMHLRWIYRGRLRGIRCFGRVPPDRGYRPGNRNFLRRRNGGSTGVRYCCGSAGRVWRKLRRRGGVCFRQRLVVGAAGLRGRAPKTVTIPSVGRLAVINVGLGGLTRKPASGKIDPERPSQERKPNGADHAATEWAAAAERCPPGRWKRVACVQPGVATALRFPNVPGALP